MNTTAPSRQGLGPLPELMLGLVTVTAIICLGRLYTTGRFAGAVVLGALASHLISAAMRRTGRGVALSALVSGVLLLLVATWVIFPFTTSSGLPSSVTWDTAVDDLRAAWKLFGEISAPVSPERGFVLATFVAVWASVFVADWAAFRVAAAFESVIPTFTLFVFAATLGTTEHRTMSTALYLSAVLLYLLVHAADRRSNAVSWFASKVRGGPRVLVRAGAAVAVSAVVLGLAVAPALPWVGGDAPIDWRNDHENGARVTVSPLVSIRRRLVEQRNVEVFTVKSDARAYWRLTSLDTFDGVIWGSRGSYDDASQNLPEGSGTEATQQAVLQEYTIGALATPWLPAAFRPDGFKGPKGVTFDPDSGSLLTEQDTADGLAYAVRSAVPSFDPAALRGAGTDIPGRIRDKYLALPDGFPASVTQLATIVTDGQDTVFGQARALQDFFREEFIYNLEVQPGHGNNALEEFLFNTREGYCEQFAGSFAAMARTLGIPARVAVGFTPGELRDDDRFHVTGRQAHAWPEVWMAGFGWVAFEPTPGRGAPGAQNYTGVPEEQDTSSGPVVTPTTLAPPVTTAPDGGTPATRPLNEPEDLSAGDAGDLFNQQGSPWSSRLRAAGLLIGTVLVLLLVGLPSWHVARRLRRRRRASASGTPAIIELAWDEAGEALAIAGVARSRAETAREFALRAGAREELAPEALAELADDLNAAAFAPDEINDDVAAHATAAADTVVAAARAVTPRRRRLAAWFDPRPPSTN